MERKVNRMVLGITKRILANTIRERTLEDGWTCDETSGRDA